MFKHLNFRILFGISTIFYTAGLYLFYIRYVPLVKSYQIILIPLLFAVFMLTALNVRNGTLFFLFVFPLINNLPFFFDIFRDIPQAPTALTLFLFYFCGWLVHRTFSKPATLSKSSILKPIYLFAAVIVISAIITFFRHANFFPFRSDSIYEFITNVNGVSAGGSIMSTLFHSLNYLSGLAFFLILLSLLKSENFIKKALLSLSVSILISVLFGYFQTYKDIAFGNDSFWIRMGQINATFIDPNAFGAVLSALLPLVIGLAIVYKKVPKIFFILLALLILFIYPQIGTRSGFLGLVAALIAFFLLVLLNFKTSKIKNSKRNLFIGLGVIFIVVLVFAILFTSSNSRLSNRIQTNIQSLVKKNGLVGLSPERFFLWSEALSMIKDYPLSGVGVGTYIIELPNYYEKDKKKFDPNLTGWQRNDSAENYFLHIGAEMGIVGVGLILWMFWLIFKRARQSFLEDKEKKEKILTIGVIAGLLSFFINFLFHSYIGSYETKFVFWFLVALLFSQGRDPVQQEKKGGKKHNFLFLFSSILLLILFGAVHLWNSTHSLSLVNRTEKYAIEQGFGFGRLEQTDTGREFRWTRKNAGNTISIERPQIEIPILASHPDIEVNPVSVKIYIIKDFFKEKKLLDHLVLRKNEWETLTYPVDDFLNQKVLLLFKVSRTWNPQKETGVPDPRRLGIAIGNIRFRDNTP